MNKIKEFFKKYKIQAIVVAVVVLAGVIFLMGKTLADPDSTALINQTVDGLSFENANLVYTDGISTFTAEVYNENDTDYTLKNISIKITDANNDVTTLIGYIGETLKKDEGKYISASIDRDISSLTKIEYVINK